MRESLKGCNSDMTAIIEFGALLVLSVFEGMSVFETRS